MFNSTVLEVAIGLVFCFASVALMASSINETIASFLKLRSANLLAGLKHLLNDQQFNGLALAIYNHALVNPRGSGTAKEEGEVRNFRPSYIVPRNFAISLIDAISNHQNDFTQLGNDIDNITDIQLKQLIKGMYTRANGNIEHLHDQLAEWFDVGMDRVSGQYKRNSQLSCFAIAFAIAVFFNIDSIHLFSSLWQHASIAAQISMPSSTTIPDFTLLKEMPIGWKVDEGLIDISSVSTFQVVGWLVTATAAQFGAPFWFDLLQQLIRLRGTGSKPKAEGK
jgi:hypothetical protein